MTQEDSPTGGEHWERGQERGRKTQERASGESRSVSLHGGYYWFPFPDRGALTWVVLMCHDLGLDAELGHVDLWSAVIERLARAWDKDARALQRRLKDRYTGLPRGRVTRPGRRLLIFHGEDSPTSDGLEQVIHRFDLDRRSVKAVYDEHETMLAEDQRTVMSALGIAFGREKAKRSFE